MIKLPRISDPPATVVLANGDYPSAPLPLAILSSAARVICCDGSADGFVARGGLPHAIVGDCDSLSAGVKERFAERIFSDPDQETNDLTKAVAFCVSRRFTDITIVGATGKREDHTLGNISLLADYRRMAERVRMITEHGVFDPIGGDSRFESFQGQQVSVFTLDPGTKITTVDLMYPLNNANLRSWWPGTLNQSGGGSFGILTDGDAIVFRLLA